MEESEIEQWYEDEKQKALDEYLKNLESNKKRDDAEREFNAKMDELIKKYNQRMAEKIDEKGKNSKLKDSISWVISKINFSNRK